MSDPVETLARAWIAWDKAPGNERLSRELETAARALSGEDTTRLRVRVVDRLRDGWPIRHAIREALTQLPEEAA